MGLVYGDEQEIRQVRGRSMYQQITVKELAASLRLGKTDSIPPKIVYRKVPPEENVTCYTE
jgi:hypothetical protein